MGISLIMASAAAMAVPQPQPAVMKTPVLLVPITASVVAVKVAISLDAQGNIIACHAPDDAPMPDYSAKVCPSFAMRGKLKPQMDDAGNPVAGTRIMTVRYRGE